MEIADKDSGKNQYKVLKMVNGDDVLCKILQEYSDALVVECPMAVTKQQVLDRPDHIVEHTGLQRWINFTNDVKFVIDKQKIMGFADLAPEVMVYYKMIAKRSKEESKIEKLEHENSTDDEILLKIKNNIDKLATLLDSDAPEITEEELTTKKTTRILH